MSLIEDLEQYFEDSVGDRIQGVSFSRFDNFRKCKRRAKLLYIDRLDEPRPPLREGQTEYPNDRGQRIHEAAELFVKGGVELIGELESFRPEFEKLRELHTTGVVSLEGDWAFDNAWLPVAWRSSNVALRMKLDAFVRPEPIYAVIIDYKSGRRSGNELKHAEQTQLYTVGVMMKFPEIEEVDVELWYPDIDDLHRVHYTRAQALRFFKTWNDRIIEIQSETQFPPNPNVYSCKWCYFGPKGSGACPEGV